MLALMTHGFCGSLCAPGPRGRGRCLSGLQPRSKAAAPSAAEPCSAPAGPSPLRPASAGRSASAAAAAPGRTLTAAAPSRFGDSSALVVRVGAWEGTLTPEAVVLHPKFKGQSGGHDLALLKLPSWKGRCLTFEPFTNAACLPPADAPSEGPAPSSCVVIVTAGWAGPGKCSTSLLFHCGLAEGTFGRASFS